MVSTNSLYIFDSKSNFSISRFFSLIIFNCIYYFSIERFVPHGWLINTSLALQNLKQSVLLKIPRISILPSNSKYDNNAGNAGKASNELDENWTEVTYKGKWKGKRSYSKNKSSIELWNNAFKFLRYLF